MDILLSTFFNTSNAGYYVAWCFNCYIFCLYDICYGNSSKPGTKSFNFTCPVLKMFNVPRLPAQTHLGDRQGLMTQPR